MCIRDSYYFDTKSNYEANLEYGYTDETLPKNYGNPIDSESIVPVSYTHLGERGRHAGAYDRLPE